MVKRNEGQPSSETQKRLDTKETSSNDVKLRDLVRDSRTKSIYTYNDFLDLVVGIRTTILLSPAAHKQDLVRVLGTIFRKPTVLEVLGKLIELRAATAYNLRVKTSLSKSSAYDALNLLIDIGLVFKTRSTKTGENRPATIYAIKDYTPDDIKNAYIRDQKLRTPAYSEMERIAQLLLDDYVSSPTSSEDVIHIYLAEINTIVKRESKGFRWWDLTEGTCCLYIQNLTAVYPNQKIVIHGS